MVGIEAAVAMGFIAGNADKELMVISDVTKEQLEAVKDYYAEKRIHTYAHEGDIKLYIRMEAKTKIIRLLSKLNIHIRILQN